jgi:hypothetical protein
VTCGYAGTAWQGLVGSLAPPAASPTCMSPHACPAHWQAVGLPAAATLLPTRSPECYGRDRAGGKRLCALGAGRPATGPLPLSRQIQEMATSRFLSGIFSTSKQSHSKSNIPFLAPKQSRSAAGRAAAGGEMAPPIWKFLNLATWR